MASHIGIHNHCTTPLSFTFGRGKQRGLNCRHRSRLSWSRLVNLARQPQIPLGSSGTTSTRCLASSSHRYMLEKSLSTFPGFPHRSSGCQELATLVRMLPALERFDAAATCSNMRYTGIRVTRRDPVGFSETSTKSIAPSRRTPGALLYSQHYKGLAVGSRAYHPTRWLASHLGWTRCS